MFSEDDWELINELSGSEDPKNARLGELLSKIMRWIRDEDTRSLEQSEYE